MVYGAHALDDPSTRVFEKHGEMAAGDHVASEHHGKQQDDADDLEHATGRTPPSRVRLVATLAASINGRP